MFSHVRAILETEDGKLHMATRFVQAAGGCASMQAKDPDTENADLGKMIVKTFPPALSTAPLFDGLVMIKHRTATACSSTSTPAVPSRRVSSRR
jgi:sulfur-oxidizing protein SoxY